jgi:hypothetical protein
MRGTGYIHDIVLFSLHALMHEHQLDWVTIQGE